MLFTSDISRAEWMIGRFESSATVAGTVGSGFEAYARILHPVDARLIDREPLHRSEWGMPPVLDEAVWRWSDLADRNGRMMHPLVQLCRLTDDYSRTSFDDGWTADPVDEGFLEPAILSEIVTALAGSSASAADDITVGIWEGWGALAGNGVVLTLSGSPSAEAQAAERTEWQSRVSPEVQEVMQQLQVEPPRLFRRRVRRPAPPLLDLPDRRYLLFTSSIDELRDPRWPITAGIGWRESRRGVMPQLVWPADSTWCIATEIDFGFTLVGGSKVAISRILASEGLEVFEVDADDDMSDEGDVINERREPAPDPGSAYA